MPKCSTLCTEHNFMTPNKTNQRDSKRLTYVKRWNPGNLFAIYGINTFERCFIHFRQWKLLNCAEVGCNRFTSRGRRNTGNTLGPIRYYTTKLLDWFLALIITDTQYVDFVALKVQWWERCSCWMDVSGYVRLQPASVSSAASCLSSPSCSSLSTATCTSAGTTPITECSLDVALSPP